MLKEKNKLPYKFDGVHDLEVTKLEFYENMGTKMDDVKKIQSSIKGDLNPEIINTKEEPEEVMSR